MSKTVKIIVSVCMILLALYSGIVAFILYRPDQWLHANIAVKIKYWYRDPKTFRECEEAGGEWKSSEGPTSNKPFPTCTYKGQSFEAIPEPGPLF